jgi:hypothetical protein
MSKKREFKKQLKQVWETISTLHTIEWLNEKLTKIDWCDLWEIIKNIL